MWRWQKYLYAGLICLLCSSFISDHTPARPLHLARIQPLLLQRSVEQPDQQFGVIVQLSTTDADAKTLITQLGGTVTKELPIIRAFAAHLPGRALPALANAPGVRWVSLDAPVNHTASGVIDSRVNSSSDDAEEEGPEGVYLGRGGMYLNSTDLEVVQDFQAPSSGTQVIGLRFTGITVPRGATITNAYLRLRAIAPDSGNSNSTSANFTILGQAVDNAPTFTSAYNNISSRTRTAAAVQWLPAAWTSGAYYNSPSVTPIVQEIVNRTGWISGNNLVLTIHCTDGVLAASCGSRSADSWDGNAATAPLLHIEWNDALAPPPTTQPAIFTTWATAAGTATAMGFANSGNAFDAGLGPNGVFAAGSNVIGAFGGFTAEVTTGTAISKVEAVLQLYATSKLSGGKEPKLTAVVGGQWGATVTLPTTAFDAFVGAAKVGVVYVDITNSRTWQWSDFDNGLQVVLDQGNVNASNTIYYDAVGLRVTSTAGGVTSSDSGGDSSPVGTVTTNQLHNVYNQVVRSSELWNTASKLQGKGITVAVVDSGVFKTKDLGKRVRSNVNFNTAYHDATDRYGHGTFVAGIVAGNGSQSGAKYVGVAPRADLLNVRVSDDHGRATEADVIEALQWVFDNKARYNIRVVNLSLNSSVAQSYHTSPLNAACEVLWFNGIVVVASAGNNGTANLFPPANDPFVITVGATSDNGTLGLSDDTVASFSAYGIAESGLPKPELVAPGRGIIGLLPENDSLNMSTTRGSNRIDNNYFRMSGTSVAAPIVSGAVALLLQDEPTLTPDQVKYRLMTTANKTWPGYNAQQAGSGYLDIYAAVNGASTTKANQNIAVSQLLWTNNQQLLWNSFTEGSVSWGAKGSAFWPSVAYNSALNNSLTWGSDYWETTVSGAALADTALLKPGEELDTTPMTEESVSGELATPVFEPTDALPENAGSNQIFMPVIEN